MNASSQPDTSAGLIPGNVTRNSTANGRAHAAPLRGLGAQAYRSAGLQAALGVVLAVLARQHSGRGQVVDVSVLESTVAARLLAACAEPGAAQREQGELYRLAAAGRTEEGFFHGHGSAP